MIFNAESAFCWFSGISALSYLKFVWDLLAHAFKGTKRTALQVRLIVSTHDYFGPQ